MKSLLALSVPLLLAATLSAHAQDKGPWRAASSNAKNITGDIEITGTRLLINFSAFPLAQIRPLSAAEASAAFGADPATVGGGNLYRLQVPPDKRLQHHNTLCGTDETQWMATWASGSGIQVAFFSGANMPVLTLDALNGSSAVCGVFGYVR